MKSSEARHMGRVAALTGQFTPCVVCGWVVYSYASRIRKYCSFVCRDISVRARRVNESAGTARCSRCGKWKDLADFVRGVNGRPHSHCLPCNAEWFAERKGGRKKPYAPMVKLDPKEKTRRKREAQKLFRTGKGREYVLMANRLRHQRLRASGVMPDRFDIGRMLCGQDARCVYCGVLLSSKYHIDHKTPVSRGGGNELENLQITCPRCNTQKHAKTHEEYLAVRK